MPVNTTIQLRKGPSSSWSFTNPVLASGEPGYDTTNNILKIGDGSTAWNSLGSIFQSSSHTHGNISNSGTIGASSGLFVLTSTSGLIIASENVDCGIIVPDTSLPSPIAYYAFDSNVDDATGNYNGTAYGSPSYVSGFIGNAIQLNSASKYVTIPRPISNDWTISFFMKTASSPVLCTNQWYNGPSLLNGEQPGAVNDFGISYLNNKIAFGVGNPDTTFFSVSSVNTNNWVHACVTRKASDGQMKIYINGVLETTGTGPTGTKSAPPTLKIGGDADELCGYSSYNGLIDNLKIFDSVLDSDQVVLLYQGN